MSWFLVTVDTPTQSPKSHKQALLLHESSQVPSPSKAIWQPILHCGLSAGTCLLGAGVMYGSRKSGSMVGVGVDGDGVPIHTPQLRGQFVRTQPMHA